VDVTSTPSRVATYPFWQHQHPEFFRRDHERLQIVYLVRQGFMPVAFGLMGGLLVAYVMGRGVARFLHGVTPADPGLLVMLLRAEWLLRRRQGLR